MKKHRISLSDKEILSVVKSLDSYGDFLAVLVSEDPSNISLCDECLLVRKLRCRLFDIVKF